MSIEENAWFAVTTQVRPGVVSMELIERRTGSRCELEMPFGLGGPLSIRSRMNHSEDFPWDMVPRRGLPDVVRWLAPFINDIPDAELIPALSPVLGAVAEALQTALAMCDPRCLALARRFRVNRYRIYRWLADDSTGRLAQAAIAVPGALLFASSLSDDRSADAGAIAGRLRERIVAGIRMDRALDEAIRDWIPICLLAAERRGHSLDALVTHASLDGLVRRKRALVRRASAGVLADELARFPPLELVPEHIPRERTANARWFRFTQQRAIRKLEVELPRSLPTFRFLSQHAGKLGGELARLLIEYAIATRRHPPLGSSLDRVLREVRVWVKRREAVRRELIHKMGGDARHYMHLPDDVLSMAFPPVPVAALESDGFSALPITAPSELVREAVTMSHCASSLAGSIAKGCRALYRVTHRGERLTLSLERRGDKWEIEDLRGFANRAASIEARAAVDAWLGAALG